MVLPGPSGVEVIRKFKSSSSATRIIICTAYDNSGLLAMGAGARWWTGPSTNRQTAALIGSIKELAEPSHQNEDKF